jgi:hypothetical protein
MILLATSDSMARFVGELALLTIAAVFVGFVISKVMPKSWNPAVFATIVPLLGLGILAYFGNVAAAMALVLFLVLAVMGAVVGVL